MNTKIITALLLATTITGCQKKPEASSTSEADPKAQFEKSDAVINSYLDKLDSPATPLEEKKQILCKDYPEEYKNNYIPSFTQSEGNVITEEKLLSDMKIALDYYKNKDNVQCE